MPTDRERQLAATMADAAYRIRRVIRDELDDAERAAKGGDGDKAAREVDDAVRKLKTIANSLGT